MATKKNTLENLKEYRNGKFFINSELKVYHDSMLIGRVNVAETPEDQENDIVCFTPFGEEIANSGASTPEDAFLKLMSLNK